MYICMENRDLYRYEVHSLIKAFYPREEVKVLVEGDPHGEKILRENPDIAMRLAFASEGITLTLAKEDRTFFKQAAPGTDDAVKGPACKEDVKHLLYDSLREVTGQDLPWGDLIGIRPTKIATAALQEGLSDEETVQRMMEEHRCSKEKAELSVGIAKREREILDSLHHGDDGYSLYIGIPFCPTTCLYCSFPSFNLDLWKDRTGEYLDCLEREMEAGAKIMAGKHLDTVYIGGGTPTSLSAKELDRLLGGIERHFDLSELTEFTVEAGRPDSITKDKLEALAAHQVTRISVNPQTMNEKTLRVIGRAHTVQQTVDAFQLARSLGFSNINMDIILGLPGEGEEEVRHTLEEVRKLHPDSLTVHSLAIKRASRLRRIIDEKGYPVLLNTKEMMDLAADAAAKMGMVPYYLYRQKNMSGNFENTGFAVPGRYGIYNIAIIEECQSILALGAGSISKRALPGEGGRGLRLERCDNAKEVDVYMANLDEMIRRKQALWGAAPDAPLTE